MTLQISGKHIELGDALKIHVEAKLDAALDKYFQRDYSVQVIFSKERSQFKADCNIHLDSGMVLQASGTGGDAHSSFDEAAEHLEKRLRRYKRRLKDHHSKGRAVSIGEAASYVLAPETDSHEETEAPINDNPVIVAESSANITSLSVSEAVMALDLSTSPVYVFRHSGNGRVNVVYRRPDGHVGWIDPKISDEIAKSA
jgi:ribosomal subunit interface protein